MAETLLAKAVLACSTGTYHEPSTTISHLPKLQLDSPFPKKVEVALEAGPGASATLQLKLQADGYLAGLVPQSAECTLCPDWFPTVF